MLRFSLFVAFIAFCGKTSASCIGECPSINPNDDVYFLPHEDCTKFCSCNYGTAIEMACPPGTQFSPADRVCVYQDSSECTSYEPIDAPTTSPIITPDPTVNDVVTSTRRLTTFSGEIGCYGPCPDVNSHASILVAHRDCTKFCKCVNGFAYQQNCPANLHFSEVFGGCTYPEDAKCDRENNGFWSSPTLPTDGWCPCKPNNVYYPISSSPRPASWHPWPTSAKVTPESWPPSERPPRPTIAPPPTYSPVNTASSDVFGCYGRCPVVDPLLVVHLIHKDCTKFCKCDRGKPVVMNCPTNLHFNPKLEVCDNPGAAQCTGIGGWGFGEQPDDNARMNVMGFNKLFRW